MSHVRPGLLGHWDRFVGPGATPVENIGNVGFGVAGVVFAPRLRRIVGPRPTGATASLSTLAVQIMAADLWGGLWCNNTPAAARWYHRPGQDAGEHLRFAAVHVTQLGVLAALDRERGAGRWRWAATHYAYLLAATALVARGGRRRQRVLGLTTAAGGVLLDRLLGASSTAPWFAPVFYTKLLAGHAAGAAVLPRDPLRESRFSR